MYVCVRGTPSLDSSNRWSDMRMYSQGMGLIRKSRVAKSTISWHCCLEDRSIMIENNYPVFCDFSEIMRKVK